MKKILFLFSLIFVLTFNNVWALEEENIPKDTTAPVIHLIGDTSVTIKVGEEYIDQSATAIDDIDKDLTSSIIVVNNVDNSKPGVYSVTYDVSDKSLNKATQIIRTVIVTEIVVPPVSPVNIHLKVASRDESFYDQDISVSPCDSDGDINTPDVATPYCALVQSGIKSEWSGLWINSIANVSNDNTNWIYWMWLANFDFSNFNLSSKQYELKSNDQILFYFNTNPLKISVDNNNPEVGSSAIVKIEELGLDASWNPVWNKATGGKIVIGSDTFDLNSDGEYKINISDLNQIEVKGQKVGFIDTPSLVIIPKEVPESTSGGSGSSGSSIVIPITPDANKEFSISKALEFLSQNKKDNGSYGDPMYTDWAAIAIAAGGKLDMKSSLIDYLKSNPVKGGVVTDYERRAMALMSLGINPYDGTSVNYINKIVDSFDGNQFGDDSLLNDDIFAILVLKNAGYGENDEMIKKDLDYIVSKQNDGSWGSVDLTSAAIQAMYGFENINQVSESITKGLSFLMSNQGNDGGFGNSFSTSWAAMSLIDEKNISKAKSYLASLQGADGGVGDVTLDSDTRVWSTSYAVPAILHKSWDSILNNFSKQIIAVKNTEEVKIQEQAEVIPVVKVEEIKKEIPVAVEKPVIKKVKSTIVKNPLVIEQKKIENINLVNKEDVKSNTPIHKSNVFKSFIGRIWSFISSLFS